MKTLLASRNICIKHKLPFIVLPIFLKCFYTYWFNEKRWARTGNDSKFKHSHKKMCPDCGENWLTHISFGYHFAHENYRLSMPKIRMKLVGLYYQSLLPMPWTRPGRGHSDHMHCQTTWTPLGCSCFPLVHVIKEHGGLLLHFTPNSLSKSYNTEENQHNGVPFY